MAIEQLSAQTAFITQYQVSQISMTTANTTRYGTLQSDALNQSVKIVSTVDVRTKQVNGNLSFTLPGQTTAIQAEATLIRDDADGFTWSGKITNQPGYVSFTKSNGLTSGFIHVGQHFYELMPMNTNYQFLVERTPGKDKGCGSAGTVPHPPGANPPGPDYCTSIGPDVNDCPALVNMLLVITPAAKTYIIDNYGSINEFAKEGQALINLAFSNSDIPNKEVAVRWIEKDLTVANGSLNANNNFDADRVNLDLLLEPERTFYRADVAFMITNQGYGKIAGGVKKYGPDKSTAYGLVEAPYFVNYYTIAHELGHLFGCLHNRTITAGDDDEVTCAHGFRWIKEVGSIVPLQTYLIDESWETVVGIAALPTFVYEQTDPNGQLYYVKFTPEAASNRILHYSNPDVNYGASATGVDVGNTADNARLIRNTACQVSSFFESQDLGLSITTSACSAIPFTFTANITPPKAGLPGQGPYTVTWYWNNDGNFNTSGIFGALENPLGSGVNLTINSHPICPGVYWVKCKLVAADGTTIVRYKKIDQSLPNCTCHVIAFNNDGDDRSMGQSTQTGSQSLVIYPNPVTDGIMTLEDHSLTNMNAHFVVSDLSGRILLSNSTFFDANGQVQISTGSLPNGVYLLRLMEENGRHYNLKFIIGKN